MNRLETDSKMVCFLRHQLKAIDFPSPEVSKPQESQGEEDEGQQEQTESPTSKVNESLIGAVKAALLAHDYIIEKLKEKKRRLPYNDESNIHGRFFIPVNSNTVGDILAEVTGHLDRMAKNVKRLEKIDTLFHEQSNKNINMPEKYLKKIAEFQNKLETAKEELCEIEL